MKKPVQPPTTEEVLPKLFASNFDKAMGIIQDLEPTDTKGRYLHWDKLMHLEPPEGITSEMWWVGIKFARQKLLKSIDLYDRNGIPFRFAMPDYVAKQLHWLDLNAAGNILSNLPITNPQMKNTYLITSLVEESINSSQLEGASTTRNVAKEMIRQGRKPRDRSEHMIFNNFNAMQFIKEIKDENLTSSAILELHKILTANTLDEPEKAGKYRTDSDDVHVVDRQDTILYTPPEAAELPERIDRLCNFANDSNPDVFIHPIVRAIILHFMLSYDHPFVDGNGRTARALFYWSVAKQGYWLMEFLSISRIIKQAPIKYGRAFLYTESDENDTTYFIIHQLEVIKKAIDDLYVFLDKKAQEIKKAETLLKGYRLLQGYLNHRQLALLRHALKHPGYVYTINEHQHSHGIVYDTARTDLMKMSDDLGLLVKEKRGKAFVFLCPVDLKERIGKAKVILKK